MASLQDINSDPLFSIDGEGELDKENLHFAVLSSTWALVERSKEVLQVIAADRENAQGDIQTVKESIQCMQAEQKKITQILEKQFPVALSRPEDRK